MNRITMTFLLLAVSMSPLEAQEREKESPGSRPLIGFHLGYAGVEKADNTLEFGAQAEVMSFKTPRLRVALGLDYLSTKTERDPQPAGSFSDLSLSGDLRFKPFRVRGAVPYLGGGIGLHFRNNDYDEENIADIYDGVAVGAQAFAGVLVDGTEGGRWGFSGEIRVVRAQNLDRTSFRAGLFLRL